MLNKIEEIIKNTEFITQKIANFFDKKLDIDDQVESQKEKIASYLKIMDSNIQGLLLQAKTPQIKRKWLNLSRQSFKIVAVGDATTYKTDFIYYYTELRKDSLVGAPPYAPPIFEEYTDNWIIHGKQYNFEIVDTGEQDDFIALRPSYYRDADLILLFFRNTIESLSEAMKILYPEIREKSNAPIIIIILTGNFDNSSNNLLETEIKNALSIIKPIRHFRVSWNNPFQSYNTMIECYNVFFKYLAKQEYFIEK